MFGLKSLFGGEATKNTTQTPSAARKPRSSQPQKASLGCDTNLPERIVPAVISAPYAVLASVTPLNGDLVSINDPVAPGLGVKVDDIAGFDTYVGINAVHGLSIVLKVKDGPLAASFGTTYGIDGFDQVALTLVQQRQAHKAIQGTVHVNDPVLLPFAPSLLVGIPPDAPVNQPNGPYGNGQPNG